MGNSDFLKAINKIALIVGWLAGLGASGGLVFDYLSNTRTIWEALLIIVVTMGSAIVSTVLYIRKKDSRVIKPLTIGAFVFYYGFLYITYPTFLPFVFAFPILAFEILSASRKELTTVCTVILTINVVGTVKKLGGQPMTTEVQSQTLIQYGSLIAFVVAVFVVVHLYEKARQTVRTSVEQIQQSQLSQQAILNDLLEMVKISNLSSKRVYENVQDTAASSNRIIESLSEMTTSISATDRRIKNEVQLVTRMQNNMTETLTLSGEMQQAFVAMSEVVETGHSTSSELQQKSQIVKENYDLFYAEMTSLMTKTEEIEKILAFIAEMAGQTQLLALNASIESARAGEAGRGFGIIAEQVRKLSNESAQASVNISTIVKEIVQGMDNNVSAIQGLKQLNQEQDQLIVKNSEVLNHIYTGVEMVKDKMTPVNQDITAALEATGTISSSMQDTTKASQQINAQFEENLQLLNSFLEKSEESVQLVTQLMTAAQQMDKYIET